MIVESDVNEGEKIDIMTVEKDTSFNDSYSGYSWTTRKFLETSLNLVDNNNSRPHYHKRLN